MTGKRRLPRAKAPCPDRGGSSQSPRGPGGADRLHHASAGGHDPPHSRHEDNEFTRSSGLYDLCLLTPRRVGLPFGRYPRLAFVWIITEAVRRQTPLLYLPRTFSQFADQLGITPSSGPKGTLVQLREQLHRWSTSPSRVSAIPPQVPQRSPACRSPPPSTRGGDSSHQAVPSLVGRSPARRGHPVLPAAQRGLLSGDRRSPDPGVTRGPSDLRSPLEMDVYMWLTWRSFRSSSAAAPGADLLARLEEPGPAPLCARSARSGTTLPPGG